MEFLGEKNKTKNTYREIMFVERESGFPFLSASLYHHFIITFRLVQFFFSPLLGQQLCRGKGVAVISLYLLLSGLLENKTILHSAVANSPRGTALAAEVAL